MQFIQVHVTGDRLFFIANVDKLAKCGLSIKEIGTNAERRYYCFWFFEYKILEHCSDAKYNFHILNVHSQCTSNIQNELPIVLKLFVIWFGNENGNVYAFRITEENYITNGMKYGWHIDDGVAQIDWLATTIRIHSQCHHTQQNDQRKW